MLICIASDYSLLNYFPTYHKLTKQLQTTIIVFEKTAENSYKKITWKIYLKCRDRKIAFIDFLKLKKSKTTSKPFY